VGTALCVVPPANFDFSFSIVIAQESMFIKALLAQASIENFNSTVYFFREKKATLLHEV
jgi:hypothetical protein